MYRRILHTLFLIAGLVFAFSCTSRRTAATLDDIETYIWERPDSALAVIRSIDTTTLRTRSLRAHYALLHAMALDKNWIDTTDLNVVMPAVTYYDRHGSDDQKMKAWYYLGRIQDNRQEWDAAGISLLKAEKKAGQTEDIRFKSLVCQALADNYATTHIPEESLKYTQLSYELSLQAGDTSGADASLYRMVQDLHNAGQYAASDSLYEELIRENRLDTHLRASLLSNYALSLINEKEDYAQAIELLEDVIALQGSLCTHKYWGAYAYALACTGEKQRADQIFSQLEAKAQSGSERYVYNAWRSLAEARSGHYESAYHLQKAASEYQTKNVKEVLKLSGVRAQKEFLAQTNLELEKAARRKQSVAGISVFLLLAVILALVVTGKRRKLKNVQEREDLLDAYKNLTMQHSVLTSRCSDLSEKVGQLEQEKALVRNRYVQLCQSQLCRSARVYEVLHYHPDENNELYRELKKALKTIGMDSQNASAFEKFLDETFEDIMTHFRAAFPERKAKYYKLVAYLFAGFDSATICAIIPDYKKHNVYVERYRLKKMIQESDCEYKEQFLRTLL